MTFSTKKSGILSESSGIPPGISGIPFFKFEFTFHSENAVSAEFRPEFRVRWSSGFVKKTKMWTLAVSPGGVPEMHAQLYKRPLSLTRRFYWSRFPWNPCPGRAACSISCFLFAWAPSWSNQNLPRPPAVLLKIPKFASPAQTPIVRGKVMKSSLLHFGNLCGRCSFYLLGAPLQTLDKAISSPNLTFTLWMAAANLGLLPSSLRSGSWPTAPVKVVALHPVVAKHEG